MNPDELNALWLRQRQRQAERREAIRQAVEESPVPLPGPLVDAVVGQHDPRMREIMRSHAGYKLAERRTSYLTSLGIVQQSLQELLAAIGQFENEALAEGSTLFDHFHEHELECFELRIQRELFTTTNAVASLVDHTRRVQKILNLPDFAAKLREHFGSEGLHDFVIALRVMLHHLHIVEAGWNMELSFSEGTKQASFKIERATLLRVIAEYPERFGRPADGPMRTFVEASDQSIDLRELFIEYRARLRAFHAWFKMQIDADSLLTLRDYDSIMLEKKKADTRMWWNAMLGNWLRNWKTPPNPHNHLHKYLTPEQLTEVYKLRRNSKEQVDLVISYVDRENAITDELRAYAYELFERSPPSEDAPPEM